MNLISFNNSSSSDARGFQVVERLYTQSGFDIKLGVREGSDIRIYEGVADGVGITFLSKIRVDIKGNTVIDENFIKTPYSREFVRKFIGEKLVAYIKEATKRQGYNVSELEINYKVNQILDKIYYEKPDAAISQVLEGWGIELKKMGNERLLGNG